MRRRSAPWAVLALLLPVAAVAQAPLPRFEAVTIDADVEIGYGVAIGDVDGDGRPDVLLAEAHAFAWYRNPGWERYVLAEELTGHDHVCLAARDVDGDGRVEVAVGAGWNPSDTLGSGAVFYLIPPADRRQRWSPVRLHNEPTVHRMRWVRVSEDDFRLVVAPLHGRGNEGGEGAGVRLLAYAMPDDPRGDWPTRVVEDSLHVTHNLDPVQWDTSSVAEEILYVGREGGRLISRDDGGWTATSFQGLRGGGEIRMGRDASGAPFVVTIEPLHGSELVYYRFGPAGGGGPLEGSERVVLDGGLAGGHALATGDLLGAGGDQIVAGWRQPNGDGRVGLKLYFRNDGSSDGWRSVFVDDGGMATEDARIGDLDGDGRLDVVAAGRATRNLVVYWNRPPR